jgi:hypothetical protein
MHTTIEEWRQRGVDYLDWWCSTDRRLIADFSSAVTCAKLADLCSPTRYKVARTVPGYGSQKYEPFTRVLNSLHNVNVTRESAPVIVEQACRELFEVYGRSIPSAISKTLWMMKGHPIVVYDRLAKGGLRKNGFVLAGLYEPYYSSWFSFFDRPSTQRALDEVCAWIPESPSAQRLVATRRTSPEELRQFVVSDRFRNRVVDVSLMQQA